MLKTTGSPCAEFAALANGLFTVEAAANSASPIRVNLLEATVIARGATTRLVGRDLAMACCIGLRERPVARPTLTSEIWPEIDDDDAINAFNVTLHRLRKRLGGREAILVTPYGYRFAAHVAIDVRALETFARNVAGRITFSEYEIALIRGAYQRLSSVDTPLSMVNDGAGALFERKIESLKRDFAAKLAATALRAERPEESLELAYEMIRLDGCDESAWEIAISANVARHDRGAAIRDYRSYVRTLKAELGLQPSHKIREIISRIPDCKVSTLE